MIGYLTAKPSRDLIEEFIERSDARGARCLWPLVPTIWHAIRVTAEEVGCGQPALMKGIGRYLGYKGTLTKGNCSLSKWSQLFCLG